MSKESQPFVLSQVNLIYCVQITSTKDFEMSQRPITIKQVTPEVIRNETYTYTEYGESLRLGDWVYLVEGERIAQLAWLESSDEVFLVCSPDNERLYKMRQDYRSLAFIRYDPDADPSLKSIDSEKNVSLVVTNATADSGLEIEKLLCDLFPWMTAEQKFLFPDVSTEIRKANNRGEFLIRTGPLYAEAIRSLAARAFQAYR